MFDVILPLANNMTIWAPAIVLLGLFVGVLTGLFGVGGGFLLTPALNIVFGIPYPIAVGSDLLQIFCTALVSAFKHWRRRNVDVRLGMVMAASAVVGAEVGKIIMGFLEKGSGPLRKTMIIFGNEHSVLVMTLDILFILLMGTVLLTILRETSETATSGEEEVSTAVSKWLRSLKIPPMMAFPTSGIADVSLWVPVVLSFFVAIPTGLLGIGGGFIMFPVFVYLMGVPTTIAVGTSAFRILFTAGYGAYAHYGVGHVEFKLVGLLLLGSVVGVQFGVYISNRIGGRRIRKYFAFVLGLGIAMIACRQLYDFLFKTVTTAGP